MSWHRLPDEPALWYGRFDKFYRPQGTERTLLEAINLWRVSEGKERTTNIGQAWANAAKEWDWKRRAEAFDESRRREAAKKEQEAWERRREERLRLLEKAKTKLNEAFDDFDTDDMSARDVLALLRFVLEQERAEQGASLSADVIKMIGESYGN